MLHNCIRCGSEREIKVEQTLPKTADAPPKTAYSHLAVYSQDSERLVCKVLTVMTHPTSMLMPQAKLKGARGRR